MESYTPTGAIQLLQEGGGDARSVKLYCKTQPLVKLSLISL